MKDRREAIASMLLRLRAMGLPHRLLNAFSQVPRQNFVPVLHLDNSYTSAQLPIECGQVMTSPDLIARILHELAPDEGSRVLEIGAGSGYQTALLANLSAKVISMERFRTLVEKAQLRLSAIDAENAAVEFRDGRGGLPGQSFDRIIANCAFEEPPRHFMDQLASGGVAIAPVGPADGRQMLKKFSKTGSRFEIVDLFEVRMQPVWSGVSQAI